jgi:hypothetical protein
MIGSWLFVICWVGIIWLLVSGGWILVVRLDIKSINNHQRIPSQQPPPQPPRQRGGQPKNP